MWLQRFKLVLRSKCRQFWWWLWTLVSDTEGCKNSFQLQQTFGKLEVLAVVLQKIGVFRDVTLYYWVCSSWRFERGWRCYDPSESQEPVTQWHNVTSLKRWILRCTCSWILTHVNPDITIYTAVSIIAGHVWGLRAIKFIWSPHLHGRCGSTVPWLGHIQDISMWAAGIKEQNVTGV